jgi:hypothetical protein
MQRIIMTDCQTNLATFVLIARIPTGGIGDYRAYEGAMFARVNGNFARLPITSGRPNIMACGLVCRRSIKEGFAVNLLHPARLVCTENLIRVDDALETPKLTE